MFGWDSVDSIESLTAELGKHYVLFPGPQDDVRSETHKKGLGNFLSRNQWKLYNGQNKDPHGCLKYGKDDRTDDFVWGWADFAYFCAPST